MMDTSRSRTSRAVSIQLAAYRCIALLTVNCRYNYTSRDIYVFCWRSEISTVYFFCGISEISTFLWEIRNIHVFVGDQKYPRFCGRSEISTFLWEIRNIHVFVGDQKYPRFCGRSELSLTACAWRPFSVMDGLVIYFTCSYHTPLSLSLSLSLCLCLSLSLSLPAPSPSLFFPRSLSARLTSFLLTAANKSVVSGAVFLDLRN